MPRGITLVVDNTSNSKFLEQLFPPLEPNEYIWWAHFEGDHKNGGSWSGLPANKFTSVLDTRRENTFYSPAIFTTVNGDTKRDATHFSRLCAVVLDDADLALLQELPPTYVIETSDGKFHAGYKLDRPINDIEEAKQLVAACTGKRSDASGNNVVRYVRLPVGLHGRSGFQQKLHMFDPLLVYNPTRLLKFFAPQEVVQTPSPSGFKGKGWQGLVQESKALVRKGSLYTDGGRKELILRWTMSMANAGKSLDDIEALVSEFTKKFDDTWTADDAKQVRTMCKRAVRKAAKQRDTETEPPPPEPDGVFLQLDDRSEWPAYPWLMKPFFMRGTVTPLVAPGGTGKSALVAMLAKHMASGTSFGPIEIEAPSRVCIITYEDSAEIYFRRCKAVRHIGSKHNDNIRIIDGKKLPESMRAWIDIDRGAVRLTTAADELGDLFEEHWKPDVLFLDTTSQINGAMEDNQTFAKLIGEMAQLAERLNACIVPVHHTGQEVARSAIIDQYSSRGGSAFSDNARGMLQLVSITPETIKKLWPGKILETHNDTRAVALVQVKANYSALSEPILMTKESDPATHSLRLTIMNTSNLPDAPTKEELKATQAEGEKGIVLEWLRALGMLPVNAASKLKEFKIAKPEGVKGQVKILLEGLLKDGLVELVDIKRGGQPTKAYKVVE